MRVDAHQHFWRFDAARDGWITDDMAVIQRDFFPGDLKPLLNQNGFDACVAVQASQSEEETDFLIGLAEANDFIKGVVGWVNLQADNVKERLERSGIDPQRRAESLTLDEWLVLFSTLR